MISPFLNRILSIVSLLAATFRKTTTPLSVASMLLLSSLSPSAKASSVLGGDLITTWIGGNKYRITFTQYKSCASVTWNTSTNGTLFCYIGKDGDSSCGSVKVALTYQKKDSLTIKCSSRQNSGSCSDAYGDIVAMHYAADIDLDKEPFKSQLAKSSCPEITFYTYAFKWRSNGLKTCYDTDMLLTAKLYVANLKSCNNSTNKGPVPLLPYYALAEKYVTNSFATGIVDTADRDYMSFKMKPVMTKFSGNGVLTTCIATATGNANIPLSPFCSPPTATCAVNLKTYPSRGSWFDTTTGDFVVSPVNDELTSFLIEISEFRKNKNGQLTLIAKHSREQTINSYYSRTNKPPVSPVSTPLNLCVGDSVCQTLFETTDFSSSTSDSLIFSLPWMPKPLAPKAISTTKLNVKHNFCVRPKIADTTSAPLLIPVMVHDNHCTELNRISKTIVVRINPKPEADITTKYLGCNKILISATNKDGKPFSINWQVTQIGASYLRASSRKSDTIIAYGNGTYLIRHLLSNGTGCFSSRTDTIKITDNPAIVKLAAKELYGNGSDSFTCKVNPFNIKAYSITGKAPFKYQWYGAGYNTLVPGEALTWTINTSNFTKIGNDSTLTLKTISDTAVYLEITDNNGCSASAFQRLAWINSDAIQWNNKPLPNICHNQKELLLISATSKNLGAASVRGTIRSSLPYYFDSLGPDRFRFRTPPVKDTGDLRVTFYVNYDTLGCTSADTTTLLVMAKPRFNLISDTLFQCTQIPTISLNKLVVKSANNTKSYTWNTLKWPAKVAKPLIFDAGTGGITDFQLQNNADSLPLGAYQIQACTQDTIDKCTWCDTAIVVSKPINKITNSPLTLCPTEPTFPLHSRLFFGKNTVDSSLYTFKLFSVNYDTSSIDFPKQVVKGTNFHPRMGQGLFIFKATPTQKCWSNSIVEINVLDTPYVVIKTDPKDSSLLPSATILFEAQTNANRVWWNFGTGNNSDTSNVASLNWAYDKKPAVYPVTLRGWGNSGCYGETQLNYVISQYNNTDDLQVTSKWINAELQVTNPDWQLQQFLLTDLTGKIILHQQNNTGISAKSILPGIYNYRIDYSSKAYPFEIKSIQGRLLHLPK